MTIRKTIALAAAGLFLGAWSADAARAQNVGQGFEPLPDQSTTRVGTRGANWLEIPVGARAQALGGSGAAIVTGAEAMAWNIGAAAEATEFSFAYSYSELFSEADITHQFVGALLPLGDVAVLGVSVVSLSSGDIIRTSERFPEGGDPQFGGTFEFSGFAASVGYSRRVTDRLNLGGAAKFVSEGIDGARAEWVGLDVGTLFRTGLFGVTIGATIQNLGGESTYTGSSIERVIAEGGDLFPTEEDIPIRFDTDEMALPTAFRFSALFDVTGTPEAWFPETPVEHRVRLAADFYDSITSALEPSLGLEYSFRNYVYGRVGKRWLNEERTEGFREFTDGISFGGGLQVPVLNRNLGIDYAHTDMGLLENIQTFSIHFGI